MDAWVVWLIAAGVLLVFEMMTLTFYLLWLSLGAAVAAIIALITPEGFLLQVLVGCLVALGLTFFTKPIVKKLRASKGFQDTGTELVGKQGVVVEPIEQGQYGIVKVGGDTWSAISTQTLRKDERVRVLERSSTIIEVERWEEII
ncbi:membrane protein implicated in regulation of membrane protease activity [Paenibacillus anaericanus]|uniref:NfeD family protein n=1 Tax=Paenibacillus anaericanus TaxID=170367 RepID=A0A3S1KBS9_9BACL|nr:NfeD family protein [Paenibacillus anaericanus]MDQ0089367.1 membrane protein implicated in regulation of membrane protease activity [Paenibacillus anaericanus]RUT48387.1 NfeD family protein [Paenibacillus anaericanus]